MVSEPGQPAFLYDFNSPYAYLAATRVDQVLPVRPRWQPVSFAFILRAHNRTPWSFDHEQRRIGIAECERRAEVYGLAPMRWPPGWPIESYGLTSLRAAVIAERHGRLREFSMAAFTRSFVLGRGIKAVADVLAVAEEAGLEAAAVERELAAEQTKRALIGATEAAVTDGVTGVPTVLACGRVFWGDDQLEVAAAALSGAVA